mgnify:CR=1 FL=1
MNGDIRLRVEGLMLERLIERALSEGARFKSVRRTGAHTMEVATDPAGERILTALFDSVRRYGKRRVHAPVRSNAQTRKRADRRICLRGDCDLLPVARVDDRDSAGRWRGD